MDAHWVYNSDTQQAIDGNDLLTEALEATLEALYMAHPVLRKTSDEGLRVAAARGSATSAAVLKACAAIARAKADTA